MRIPNVERRYLARSKVGQSPYCSKLLTYTNELTHPPTYINHMITDVFASVLLRGYEEIGTLSHTPQCYSYL